MFVVLLLFFFSSIQSLSSFVYLLYYVSVCVGVCVIISTRSGREGEEEDVCHVLHMIIYYIVYTLLLLLMWSVHLAHIGGGTQVSGYCFPH